MGKLGWQVFRIGDKGTEGNRHGEDRLNWGLEGGGGGWYWSNENW
jgi:hypothetical protein